MGPTYIWIAASFAYAALSAAIYIWIYRPRSSSSRRLLSRAAVAFAGYLAFALAVVWVLYRLVGK